MPYDRREPPMPYDRREPPMPYDRRQPPMAYDRREPPMGFDRREPVGRRPGVYDREPVTNDRDDPRDPLGSKPFREPTTASRRGANPVPTYAEYMARRDGGGGTPPLPPEPQMGPRGRRSTSWGREPYYDEPPEYFDGLPPPAAGLSLEDKVTLIKTKVGLDPALTVAEAIRIAKQEVGCLAEGTLNEQAEALLFELMPSY